ncbi:MAG: ABC transporter permease [Tannerellaceae bacterium]|jgi:ABC-2 type transport system permease protein|nr:ABC transporter permease [Tannerellaceae bacterium]
MNKIAIIIKREYLRRVSKKSFLILTLCMPFLIAAMVVVPLWLSQIKSGEARNVVVIDNTGKYAPLFTDTENYRFVAGDKALDNYRNSDDKEAFAILSITGDLLDNPAAAVLYSAKQVPGDLTRLVNQTLKQRLESDKLASFDIPDLKEIIQESRVNFSITTIKWSDDGRDQVSSSKIASIAGLASTIIIYAFIMMYGSMVMQGVLEEKTNRIVELMVSSVRPFDLMMGKIIALGFVGLTQLLLWTIMTNCLLFGAMFFISGSFGLPDMASATTPPEMALPEASGAMADIYGALGAINVGQMLLFFIIYFIGGYLLYASLFAAIGSSVSQQEDTQQFMTPVMIIIVFALYAGIYSLENPDGPLAFWCSLIPFTSPIVMMVRIPFDVPLWEKMLSITLLYVTAVAIAWASAKIYRVGILMYGKKPSIREVAKWIRYK